MKVIAIDPGYERMGIAVVEHKKGTSDTLLYSACVRTSPKLEFSERLFNLGEEFWLQIRKWKPEVFAVEKLYFENNQKTAMNVAEVKGMLAYIAMSEKLRVAEFTPLQIKVAVTGYGRATKADIFKMIPKLIDIKKEIELDDEYDAIAIALTCLATKR
ncbi:MAG: crossover junction endodeoxyribonuclease RuvC [Candidatus Paceibacterota bacterium]|jgi:crossover junction endodeoxyribonuclease RuvC